MLRSHRLSLGVTSALVTITLLLAASASHAAITNYWPLNEGAGTTANNLAGGTNGTLVNQATGGQGVGGDAWVLNDTFRGVVFSGNNNDSTGAFINAGSIPQAEINGNFTWSFWYANTGSGGNDVVLGNRFNGPGGRWAKFTPSNFEWQTASNGGNVNITDIAGDGWWHHYAVVKNGTNFQTYIDGVPDASANFTGTFSGALPFFIGGDAQVPGERPGGRYSEVATFDEALTQTQIQTIRNGDFSAFGQTSGQGLVQYPAATAQKNSVGFTVSSIDILEGLVPVVSGAGDAVNAEEGRTVTDVSVLTNGVFGPADAPNAPNSNQIVAIHDGTILTYALPDKFDITGIDTYAGWNDTGRDNQDYLVEVALAGDPNTFIALTQVNYHPGGANPSDTAVFLTNPGTGPLATNVVAIRFSFLSNTENGWVGYREFDVFGQASPVPEPASAGLSLLGIAGLLLRRKRSRA